jgi:hypothetical protein
VDVDALAPTIQFDPVSSLAIVVLPGQHLYRVVAHPPVGVVGVGGAGGVGGVGGVGGFGVGFGRGRGL